MNTDARRKASTAYHAKRTQEGYKKVTLWLHEDTRAELDRLAKVYGSKDKAAAMAIDHHSHERRRKESDARIKANVAADPDYYDKLPSRAPAVPYGSRLKKPKP